MKSVLLLSLVLFPTISSANVKKVGEFVPSLCSRDREAANRPAIVAVKGVCLGNIFGRAGQVLEVTVNDGEVRRYAIKQERPLRGMGSHSTRFDGKLLAARTFGQPDTVRGVLSMTSGITVTHGISFKTDSNLEFRGPLDMVFVPQ